MRYRLFLLILEGVCIYFLSIFTSAIKLYPHAILISYLFVSLLAFLTPNISCWRSWRAVFFFNIVCILGVLGFLSYKWDRAGIRDMTIKELQPLWTPLAGSFSSPLKDRAPFINSLHAWLFHEYPQAKKWVYELTSKKIRRLYIKELHRDEKLWIQKKRIFIQHYPQFQKELSLFEKENCGFLSSLSSLEEFLSFFQSWKGCSKTFRNDTTLTEEALMVQHYRLVSKYKEFLPTLSLLPQTMKRFPDLWERVGERSNLSILDFFVLQNPPSGKFLNSLMMDNEYIPKNLSAKQLVYEPSTKLLLLFDGYVGRKRFSMAKVLSNQLILFSGRQTQNLPFQGIRNRLLKSISQIQNPLDIHWFFPSYIHKHNQYYKNHIQPFQTNLLFFLGGFVLITLLSGIYGLAFQALSKISPISWVLGVFFSLFLSYLFYELVLEVLPKLLSFEV